MSAGPVARAARGGLTRRRVQTFVIGLVLLISTGASVLALAIVVDSNAPFDHAFTAQHGADVAATVNSARATTAQLAATKRLPEVTAAAGPFAEATVTATVPSQPGCNPGPDSSCLIGGPLPPITLAGRAAPGGGVDDLTLQSGHWATQPGQVVLDGSGSGPQLGVPVGTTLTIASAPGKPALTVVGIASSVTGSADGWVLPGQVAALRSAGSPATSELLYRFRSAASAADLSADMAAVRSALPPGTVTGSLSYLAVKTLETGDIAPFVPFLFAFGVIGMVMSVLIVTNVVSGAVVAGYRRIGILKSIGFTPGQVVAAYTGQVSVPAFAGCIGGVLLGNLIARPVLAQTASAYGVGSLSVPLWVDIAVPVVMLCLVGIAALLPAVRAGRLNVVQAIATGRAPRTGRGYAAHRLLGRLRLPRPLTIGLAAPFARPARTSVTMVAILLGAAAVTLAVGLSTSLNMVVEALSHTQTEPVQVAVPGKAGPGGGIIHVQAAHGGGAPGPAGQPPSAAQAQRAIETALRAQPGTLRFVAETDQIVSVAGLSQQAMVTAFRGNASWTGYDIIAGHWYTGPGQVDVPARFLTVTGDAVGDSVTIINGNRQVTARIVGEVFSTSNDGLELITGWKTLASIMPGVTPSQYDVGLRPGTSEVAYIQAVSNRLGPQYPVFPNQRHSHLLQLMVVLIGTLTLLLTVVAGLGVLNTVVLHIRERVHDIGVFKAIGMTPRQTIVMVVCWVAGTGLVAGLIAVPAGMVLHGAVLPAMANAADVGVPANLVNVYHPAEMAGLALAGVVIAVAGALLPASWAAATRTGAALHAE
ncbi:MAG TPA: FtsX-like permease family protein [Streptosporangiaceae bacterium]|nr:FtsX-like permease family protein [Streptosporangiaceae bacterium]